LHSLLELWAESVSNCYITMIKFLPLEVLDLSHRIPRKIKNAAYRLLISTLVPELFKFENCVNMQMRWLMMSYTQPNITSSIFINRAISVNLQQKSLRPDGLIQCSCTCNILTAIKIFVPMVSHSFPVPSNLISIF